MEKSNRPDFIQDLTDESYKFYFDKSSRLATAVAESCDLILSNAAHASGLSLLVYEKLKTALLTEVEIERKRIADYMQKSKGDSCG